MPGQQAEASGGIRVGDIIISVNHEDMRAKSHPEVVAALKACTYEVVIGLTADDSPLPEPESIA